MNLVYLYEGDFKHGKEGEYLIKWAATLYCKEKGMPLDIENSKIEREEKGKPYFVNLPIHFSLTHSGNLWMCMFSDKACGIDLQMEKDCNFEKLSERTYTKEEQHYVDLWGQGGFFDVWVRKEAFVKFTGQGLFTEMPSVVDDKADLLEEISHKGQNYYLQSIEISDEIKCAVCTENEDTIGLRILG